MENNNCYTLPRQSKSSNHTDSRPLSLYDNLRLGTKSSGSLSSLSLGNLNTSRERIKNTATIRIPPLFIDRNKSPSQANCLSTTVPQNIAGNTIAGRHTPTRNSLRHSRMIVLTRNGKVPRKYMPPVLHHYNLAVALAVLQIFIGIAVLTIALWFIFWAPNLRVQDIPYWSGGPLAISGVLNLFLLLCCKKDYHGHPLTCYIYSFKVVSLTVSAVALVTGFCACIFAAIHLFFLYTMTCVPENVLSENCECYSVISNNITESSSRIYKYLDLNCLEVHNILSILIIASLATNLIGGILEILYVYLHWSSRYSYVYSQVKTSDNKPMIIANKL
uniref:Sarcospan n=1 Tax=Clastoptera arizonana TaxID=38151 RepID=A0A1B6E950_9HEMI